MPGAREADKFRDVFQILAEYELLAFGDHRQVANPVREQPFASAGVVEYVDRGEIDALFRKKLFRSQAAASPGLGEKRETFGGFH